MEYLNGGCSILKEGQTDYYKLIIFNQNLIENEFSIIVFSVLV